MKQGQWRARIPECPLSPPGINSTEVVCARGRSLGARPPFPQAHGQRTMAQNGRCSVELMVGWRKEEGLKKRVGGCLTQRPNRRRANNPMSISSPPERGWEVINTSKTPTDEGLSVNIVVHTAGA